MPNSWLILPCQRCEPAWNMALDESLLLAMPRLERPVLRFYGWTEPAATFGYFQKYAEVEQLTALRPLVRRPTGGGIVPHDIDWTYSITVPVRHPWHQLKAIESYRRAHELVQTAFGRVGIAAELAPCCSKIGPGQCFAGYEQFDVLWHGRKIGGAAQRRNRHGLLIQGSVQAVLFRAERAAWERAFVEALAAREGVACETALLEDAVLASANDLARSKYSQATYNQKR